MKIKEHEMYEIDIQDMGEDGEGIGRIDGFTVFVPGGIVGDTVRIKLTKKKKQYGTGRIIKLIKASEYRTEPPCQYAYTCGGCQIQHMTYDKQLVQKTAVVEACMKRIGKLESYELNPIIGMEDPYFYRNKGQYPVGKNEQGHVEIGFYKTKTHQIVDVDRCLIQNDNNNAILSFLKSMIQELEISVYDEHKHKGLLRHIMLRNTKDGKWMVVFVTNGSEFPKAQQMIYRLEDEHPEVVSIIQNINRSKGNRILGFENKVLSGTHTIEDGIGELTFELSPLSFFQVNPLQTEKLYAKALEYAELKGEETVVDVYCGIGTISLFLAQKAKKVIGVEVIEDAIQDAKANAVRNRLTNTEFYAGKAEKVLPKLYKEGLRADVVVVDPPRKGCERIVLETIAGMHPERIVYVSCKPSTLARDLKILGELGYETEKVQPVDMFPHSMHVETIVALYKKD